jgi:hypothetical protein
MDSASLLEEFGLSPVDRIQFLGVRYEATPRIFLPRGQSGTVPIPTNKQEAFSF